MNRDEVKQNLLLIQAKIAEIDSNDDPVLYATKDKYLNGVGYINEIATFTELAVAQERINRACNKKRSVEITELGLTEKELGVETEVKILGYKPKFWYQDIQTRLAELRKITRRAELVEAEAVLTKNLSADDKFSLETKNINMSALVAA
jgi:hypothetical protein